MTTERPDEDPLVQLLLDAYAMHPDALVPRVLEAVAAAGGAAPEVWVADVGQAVLRRLDGHQPMHAVPVDSLPEGEVFRDIAVRLDGLEDGRTRLYVPIMDSAERVGVLAVTVGDTSERAVRWWMALASLLGELYMSKKSYGDNLIRARRRTEPTLAAEMRLHWQPALTFVSPELTITGFFEPAYQIAGDTFDYAINGTTAHLALFDAMGHGLEASRMASVAVAAYRHSRRAGLDLPSIVADADAVIAEEFGDTRFVTGQLGTFDTETGALEVVNMGHPLPLVFHDGRFRGPLACEPCVPLGLGSRAAVAGTATLEPGDIVVFHTDGVTEARAPDGAPFGEARLVEVMEAELHGGARPSEALRRVVEAALEHQGGKAQDDATLLLLGYRLPATDPMQAGGFGPQTGT
jgi:hypothetical protein